MRGRENIIRAQQRMRSIGDRFVIEKAAMDLGIPLVHGAIAGFEGQMMTIWPGDGGLKQLYGKKPPKKKTPCRLKPYWVCHADMPFTPAQVWMTMQGKPLRTDLAFTD